MTPPTPPAPPAPALQLRALPYTHPDAQAMIGELQAEYVVRYGSEDATPVDPAEFAAPAGYFAAGYRGGRPAACGGWRILDRDAPVLAPTSAELKRLFVRPAARGTGLARAFLAHLEEAAAVQGLRRMVLHCGLNQPEAVALYRSSGYTEVEGWGPYRYEDLSLYFAKNLPRRSGGLSGRPWGTG